MTIFRSFGNRSPNVALYQACALIALGTIAAISFTTNSQLGAMSTDGQNPTLPSQDARVGASRSAAMVGTGKKGMGEAISAKLVHSNLQSALCHLEWSL
jgi:hypothetical protein